MRNNKGFTLIELMVVIVIIGILAVLAIPRFTGASVKAKASEVPTVLSSYENAQLAYLAETGALGDVTALVFDVPGVAGVTKWWTYTEAAAGDGSYQGVATAAIGDITAGHGISTTISAAGVITHAKNVGGNTAAKYFPNW